MSPHWKTTWNSEIHVCMKVRIDDCSGSHQAALEQGLLQPSRPTRGHLQLLTFKCLRTKEKHCLCSPFPSSSLEKVFFRKGVWKKDPGISIWSTRERHMMLAGSGKRE